MCGRPTCNKSNDQGSDLSGLKDFIQAAEQVLRGPQQPRKYSQARACDMQRLRRQGPPGRNSGGRPPPSASTPGARHRRLPGRPATGESSSQTPNEAWWGSLHSSKVPQLRRCPDLSDQGGSPQISARSPRRPPQPPAAGPCGQPEAVKASQGVGDQWAMPAQTAPAISECSGAVRPTMAKQAASRP